MKDMLLIKKKVLLIEALTQTIKKLHYGEKNAIYALLKEIKDLSSEMAPEVQKDIIDFIQQVTFQMDYDPQHLVTEEIRKSLDQLLSDLGFVPPKK